MAQIVDLGPIWRQLLGNKPPETSRHIDLFHKRVEILQKLPPEILRCGHNASLTREELDNLLTTFSQENSARTISFVIRFLAKGLSEGRKTLGWKVAIPPVTITIKREQSRFTPAGFVELSRLRQIEAAFIKSLRNASALSYEQHLGRLLLSAMLFGGLIQRQWLEPWLRAISKPKVMIHDTILWVDMERVWQHPRKASDVYYEGSRKRNAEAPIFMNRRWIGDPVTRSLILQWLQLPGLIDRKNRHLPNAYDLVTMFLKKVGLAKELHPVNLKHLIVMAEIRLGLIVPSYLASYAAGDIVSVSVPAETWTRLLSGKAVPRQATGGPGNDEDHALRTQKPWESPFHSMMLVPDEQRNLLSRLRKLFSKTRGVKKSIPSLLSEIDLFVKANAAQLCPLILFLAKWSEYLLSDRGRNKPSTVERYLGSVAAKLLAVFENEDLQEMETAEFIEFYDRLVETVTSYNESGYALQTLGRFHRFLVQHHGVANIHSGYFSKRSGPPETRVNANLVSQTEFDRLKTVLGFEDNNRSRTATACLLVAIFGFRCGLRRNEVLFLRVRDIMGRHKPELVLRPTSKRGLKTSGSSRRIPLHLLLPPDEMALLHEWLSQHELLGKEALLFEMLGRPMEPMPESNLMRPIREALHRATGDQTLSFHTLRHSFASWLMVRLAGNAAKLRSAAPFLDHPEFEEPRVMALRKSLLGNEYLGRPAAFAVSSLCGHADLSTTFANYLHLSDWLLSRALSDPSAIPDLDVEALIGVTALSRASIYRNVTNRNMRFFTGWPHLFRSLLAKGNMDLGDPLLLSAKEPNTNRIEFPEENGYHRLWLVIEKALTMHQVMKISVAEIAGRLLVSQETLENWFAKARYIANLRVDENHHSYRHRTVARHLELVGHDDERRELWSCKTGAAMKDYFRNPKRKTTGLNTRIHPLKQKWKKSISQSLHPERFPIAPRLDAEQQLVERYMTVFEKLSPDMKEKVIQFVDYYCESYCKNSGGLWHSSASWARNHLEVLDMLGVPTGNIELVDFKTIGEGPKERSVRRKGCEEKLGVAGVTWHAIEKRLTNKRVSCGIGIRDIVMVGGSRRASYAFRYMMYILRIGYWD